MRRLCYLLLFSLIFCMVLDFIFPNLTITKLLAFILGCFMYILIIIKSAKEKKWFECFLLVNGFISILSLFFAFHENSADPIRLILGCVGVVTFFFHLVFGFYVWNQSENIKNKKY